MIFTTFSNKIQLAYKKISLIESILQRNLNVFLIKIRIFHAETGLFPMRIHRGKRTSGKDAPPVP